MLNYILASPPYSIAEQAMGQMRVLVTFNKISAHLSHLLRNFSCFLPSTISNEDFDASFLFCIQIYHASLLFKLLIIFSTTSISKACFFVKISLCTSQVFSSPFTSCIIFARKKRSLPKLW